MLVTGALPAALAMSVVRLDVGNDRSVQVELTAERAGVACPACGAVTPRVHGRYRRTLAELPRQGLPAHLCLTTRGFHYSLAGPWRPYLLPLTHT